MAGGDRVVCSGDGEIKEKISLVGNEDAYLHLYTVWDGNSKKLLFLPNGGCPLSIVHLGAVRGIVFYYLSSS